MRKIPEKGSFRFAETMVTIMSKELSEMTLGELWELFPIFLVAHRERWKEDYREIESELRGLLSDCGSPRIHHIGSTSTTGTHIRMPRRTLSAAGHRKPESNTGTDTADKKGSIIL